MNDWNAFQAGYVATMTSTSEHYTSLISFPSEDVTVNTYWNRPEIYKAMLNKHNGSQVHTWL